MHLRIRGMLFSAPRITCLLLTKTSLALFRKTNSISDKTTSPLRTAPCVTQPGHPPRGTPSVLYLTPVAH